MGRLAVAVVVLFLSSVTFSRASELPESGVISGDLPSAVCESTDDTILLPAKSEDSAGSEQPENEIRTNIESNKEVKVTTVAFRPAGHSLDGRPMMPASFRFPCRHCHRPFKPLYLPVQGREIPHWNDMILASEKLDSEGGLDTARSTMTFAATAAATTTTRRRKRRK